MNPDFEQIKRDVDLVEAVQRRGVELKREGKDWRGRCPFHDDRKRPNFIVSPEKGLWRCPACNASGNVIQFVARIENLSEREAALKLLGEMPDIKRKEETSSRSVSSSPVVEVRPAIRTKLLTRVVGFYFKTLHKDRAGLDYLKTRRLDDPAMLEIFSVGYCNGSMREALPKEGETVEQLKAIGVLNGSGNEVFYKRIVVPLFDSAGHVVSLYGRRLDNEESKHLHLKGERRGVFNAVAAKNHPSLIIVESIFDAMSLWAAGFHNVIALRGKDGWSNEHTELIGRNGVKELYIALDGDKWGQMGAGKLEAKLVELGVTTHRLSWSEGIKDANDFFLSSRTADDFAALLKAANPKAEPENANEKRLGKERVEMRADGFAVVYGAGATARRYELCALESRPGAPRLKATIKATVDEPESSRFVLDTVDFCSMRSKRGFILEAARLFRETAEVIESDVNRLTLQAQEYAQQRLEERPATASLVSESDRAEGTKFGRHRDLVSEILRDLEKLGLVGEENNKLLLYLVMTSRKMSDPLAVQILSGSGAGKTHLQDAVLSLCPDEDLVKLTTLTDRALFYKGEDSLRHKVLALEEVAGAEGARYALRSLVSSKKLVSESTVKNILTGRMETQTNIVYGPSAVFETTTRPDTEPETRSRFLITSIDESAEQTKRILEAQRQSHTLEGLKRQKQRAAIIARHHALQRLLRPVVVVNPYEPLLAYGDNRLLFRRDNPKYQRLILAVTFLHQFQRIVKHDEILGDYIETTLGDIAVAHDLALKLFGQSLDELSRPSAELLRLIRRMVDEFAAKRQISADEIRFTRREVREFAGWSDYQVKVHIKQLEELEYLIPISGKRGQLFSYRLAWDGQEGRFLPGLVNMEELRKKAELVGLLPEQGGRKNALEGVGSAEVGTSENGARAPEHETSERSGGEKEGSDREHVHENAMGHREKTP